MADSKSSEDANVDHFLLNLYKEVSTERRWRDELSDIASATKEMIQRIVDDAVSPYKGEYESEGVTNIDVKEAGSMADGTSICDPDEFDFILAFTYSSDVLTTQPSSNLRDISFSKYTIKPKDPRYRQLFLRKNMVDSSLFIKRNFQRLENAIVKVSGNGPVIRGEKSLYLCVADGNEKRNSQQLENTIVRVSGSEPVKRGSNSLGNAFGSKSYYGMQGPSFHLHNLLKWCSPNRINDFYISVDLVPAIQLADKAVFDHVPVFKQECPCKNHDVEWSEHCLLLPLKCRELVMSSFHRYGDWDEDYWKAKNEFLESNFMVSVSEYENNIMKQWKCEKSIYHNWYICYTLMKCFGKLDHNCSSTVRFLDGNTVIKMHKPMSIPEHNDSFSSYSWKNLVFTKAQKESRRCATVKNCFDCLTSVFEEENLRKSPVVTIDSFWCPSEIAETIKLRKKDSQEYTLFVESMISLKTMLNEINIDSSYTYEKYKEKLLQLFPELSSHLLFNKS